MSGAEELFTALAGLVAVLGFIRTLLPRLRRYRARRRQHWADHEGTAPRVENGVTIEPAKQGIAAQLHEISGGQTKIQTAVTSIQVQLAELGGDSAAIAEIRALLISTQAEGERRHTENQRAIAEVRLAAESSRTDIARLKVDVVEVRQLADEAAAHALKLDDALAEIKDRIWQRFADQELRNEAYVAALMELGIQVEHPTE